MLPKLHTIGRVAGKHGFQGELQLHFHKDIFAKAIQHGDFLFISIDQKGVPFLLEKFNPKNGVAKFADVETVDQASILEGLPLLATIEETSQDTLDWSSIEGFQVFESSGQTIGNLLRVEEFPAGPMLILEKEDGEIMIPLVEEWIVDMNPGKKQLHLDIPDGLIDL